MGGEAYAEAANLVLTERWAALGTLNEGAPLVSMTSYAVEPGLTGVLMLLSPLSLHTRNLLDDPRASLSVTRPDTGVGDPQELPRVTLSGTCVALEKGSDADRAGREVYAARFPEAGPRLGLPDMLLFRFVPEAARYVGGFGRAARMTGAQLATAARS
ncbi:pyridoxamine 5'-phosphate oxidase [Acidobacteria bacterium ACD]|nr:MAG: pyridoxamine 5'-phosphate oxidase [Acidobacteriota bacterium]MCE7958070.1 pyridoxamine 5'-phosphate oxidase [Acidobacteria bacterium ACB2]MDL1948264.1 pyridoxamine 5'-phosphate oxidase [Acidobacteria bacterium ACD]